MIVVDPVKIDRIPASLVYPVRQAVLRPGRPSNESHFPGDDLDSTFHLGLFYAGLLVGVATYMNSDSEMFDHPHQFQLRGMAVLGNHTGKGYGTALLKAGEKELIKIEKPWLLWFNARDYAVGFYERYGYNIIGEKFDIPGVCKHIVMFKYLP